MTIARMPGRASAPRDTRNCYMSDEEVVRREEAYALWRQVEKDHAGLAEIVWWAIIAIASVIAFGAGLYLGGGQK